MRNSLTIDTIDDSKLDEGQGRSDGGTRNGITSTTKLNLLALSLQ
jgi:hypothetical protein